MLISEDLIGFFAGTDSVRVDVGVKALNNIVVSYTNILLDKK